MSVYSNDAGSGILPGHSPVPDPSPSKAPHPPETDAEGVNSGITLGDVKRVLGAFYKLLPSVSAGEYVFGWCGRAEIDIRIHTTIDKQTQKLRPSGTDAIRIVLFDLRARRKIHPWTVTLRRAGSHVLDRLQKEAGAALLRASFRPHCPHCRKDAMCITPLAETTKQSWRCRTPDCSGGLRL